MSFLEIPKGVSACLYEGIAATIFQVRFAKEHLGISVLHRLEHIQDGIQFYKANCTNYVPVEKLEAMYFELAQLIDGAPAAGDVAAGDQE